MKKIAKIILSSLIVTSVVYTPTLWAMVAIPKGLSSHFSTGSEAANRPLSVININQATVEQLETVKGLGKKKARLIISYRENQGPFKSLGELAQVKGISQNLLKKIGGHLSVE